MNIKKFIKAIKTIKANDIVLVDIGARTGLEDVLKTLDSVLPLQVVGFEPEPDEFERLQKEKPQNVTLLNTALSNNKGEKSFYITKEAGLSSIYKPNYELLKEIETDESFEKYSIAKELLIHTDTLDNQLKLSNICHADFIKIDTEGSEVDILVGAQATLKNTVFGVESEISFVEMREKQLTFSDLHEYLSGLGFHLFDLKNRYMKRPRGQKYGMMKGQLIYCDALYFKSIDGFQTSLEQFEPETQQLMIVNAMVLSGVYGYFDYAHEIFRQFESVFGESEKECIIKAFEYSKVNLLRIPHFPGRGTLSRFFYTIALILASRVNDRTAIKFGNNIIGNIEW
jgi:FkbM family methyltransferase